MDCCNCHKAMRFFNQGAIVVDDDIRGEITLTDINFYLCEKCKGRIMLQSEINKAEHQYKGKVGPDCCEDRYQLKSALNLIWISEDEK